TAPRCERVSMALIIAVRSAPRTEKREGIDGNSAAAYLETDPCRRPRGGDAADRLTRCDEVAGPHGGLGEAGGGAAQNPSWVDADDGTGAAQGPDPADLAGGGGDDLGRLGVELDAAADEPRVCAFVVVAAEGCHHVALDRAQERPVARRLHGGEGGAGGVGLEARDVGLGGAVLGAEDLPLLEGAEDDATGGAARRQRGAARGVVDPERHVAR